ncbi:hypothetical protein CHREV_251 [Choristoneura rosaceana entomopoxvirus 'L']|uniref:Uncharacterized protein n=1 Tax=Choristoneura rosaceana entomopoxvirus 'L' TaxID=1293539 RepID=A0ABP1WMP2_9POXV|nr:hypothetical protein CHREV_251 [Choristoneura rosaceana entomopoxvirus 'L']CCU56153.1 hypothetical protein CHREV_251 [Choristoneura rosaceana entomopoxvirus 'L']
MNEDRYISLATYITLIYIIEYLCKIIYTLIKFLYYMCKIAIYYIIILCIQ